VLRATWFVLAGMGIVFATLTILMLALIALNRLLGPRKQSSGDRAIASRTPGAASAVKGHTEGRAGAHRARTSTAADA
jgi:Na+-transporting methylmalonyl-CoA/oxaloacetate decarboxylase gamma subunit